MPQSWSDFLAARGALGEGADLRFGDLAAEARLAQTGAAVVPLTHLGLIRARGEEAAGFLHNLFSNDVKTQAPEQARWNSFNSAKGRMLANFLVWRRGEGYLLAPIHLTMQIVNLDSHLHQIVGELLRHPLSE